jgi:hypothetical protein
MGRTRDEASKNNAVLMDANRSIYAHEVAQFG